MTWAYILRSLVLVMTIGMCDLVSDISAWFSYVLHRVLTHCGFLHHATSHWE